MNPAVQQPRTTLRSSIQTCWRSCCASRSRSCWRSSRWCKVTLLSSIRAHSPPAFHRLCCAVPCCAVLLCRAGLRALDMHRAPLIPVLQAEEDIRYQAGGGGGGGGGGGAAGLVCSFMYPSQR